MLFTTEDRTDSKKLYEGHIFSVRLDNLRSKEGVEVTREVVEHNGGVVVIARPEPSKVILVRQYRYSLDKEILELPAGRIEVGEDPMVAAKRELTEETGYEASQWRTVTDLYTAPGFCTEVLYMYEASNLSFKGKNLDMDEETEVVVMDVSEAWAKVLDGTIKDAKTVAGIGLVR